VLLLSGLCCPPHFLVIHTLLCRSHTRFSELNLCAPLIYGYLLFFSCSSSEAADKDVEMAETKEGEAESGVDDRTLFDFCMSVLRLEYDSHLLQVLHLYFQHAQDKLSLRA
jgi:hypothetical protein